MELIFFDNGPDGVGVIWPSPYAFLNEDGIERAMTVAEIAVKDVPVGAEFVIVDVDEDIDRTFRNAWKYHAKEGFAVDMPKAREIHRDRMRIARTPLMTALDVEYFKTDEKADLAQRAIVAAKKQALRDVTNDPRIEAAQTPEELKAVWPEVLG